MDLIHRELSYQLVGAAMQVHTELGRGFLEKVYENALMIALREVGIAARQQVPVTVSFHGMPVGEYRADILVEESILLELKTVECIVSAHQAQMLNYLKATGIKLGMIINFGGERLEYERLIL